MGLSRSDRADLYNTRWPDRPHIFYTNGYLVGTWSVGADYRNRSTLYGAYPNSYLERVHTLFPDARHILHAFSGSLTANECRKIAWPYEDGSLWQEHASKDECSIELVDIKGSYDGRFPTWEGDVGNMPDEWENRFDLILADPPYSTEDANKYGTTMINRGSIMRELYRVGCPKANLVWLDQVWPIHKATQWQSWGEIGFKRSSNHRMRLVSIFESKK